MTKAEERKRATAWKRWKRNKRKSETKFVGWVLSLHERARYRDELTAFPEREYDHHGDPGDIRWSIKLPGGTLKLWHRYERAYSGDGVNDYISAELLEHPAYVCRDWESPKESKTLSELVSAANDIINGAPLPVDASWLPRNEALA